MDPGEASQRRKPPTRLIKVMALLATVCLAFLAAAYVAADRLTEPGDPVVGVSAIAVRDNSFSPDSVSVPPGTTITWTWEGSAKHNLHGEAFEAPAQDHGTFSHTFDEVGTYDYECTLHFGMKGRVIVSASPTT